MVKLQFSKFILIGILSTTVNYVIFYVLFHFFNIHYILSSAIGFISGVFAGYGLNRSWTFKVRDKHKMHAVKYCFVYAISLFLGLAFLKSLVSILHVSPKIANILMIGLTTITNFVGIKTWVFRK